MKYNIASFDGGGIRGIMSLEIAKEIEKRTALKFKELFPVLSGTSTGGIIAAMLAVGYPSKQIAEIYEREGKKIFKKKAFSTGIFRTKYSEKYLEKMLKTYFGDRRLRELDVRLIIPAYRQDIDDIEIFDSANPEHGHFYLRDVVRATSAAPTYFKSASFNGAVYSDGGVVLNNPTLWSYIQEMKKRGSDKLYNIVSIGTSRQDQPIYWKGGVVGWIVKLIPAMMNGHAKLSHRLTDELCEVLSDNYWRLEPKREYSSGKMDDVSGDNIRNMILDGERSVDIFEKQILAITHELIKHS